MSFEGIFQHDPLSSPKKQIRLLTLMPEDFNANEIVCQLRTTYFINLSNKESGYRYDALSYAWGPPDNLGHHIILEGKRFPVRKNLWDALVNLRDQSRPRVLWIDAICISQEDVNERNHQVRLMKNIYRGAACVRIWLGTLTTGGSIALGVIEKFGREHEANDIHLIEFATHSFVPRMIAFKDDLNNKTHAYEYESLGAELFDNEYWGRLWIIQEVLMAKKPCIHWGNRVLSWDIFSRALDVMESTFEDLPGIWAYSSRTIYVRDVVRAFTKTNAVQLLRRHEANKISILKLLSIAQNASCSDQRDKIYGILGLARNLSIPVDYQKSVFEVFCDMMTLAPEVLHHDTSGFHLVNYSQCLQSLLAGPHKMATSTVSCISVKGFVTSEIKRLGPIYEPAEFNQKKAAKVRSSLFVQGLRYRYNPIKKYKHRGKSERLEASLEGIDNVTARKLQTILPHAFFSSTETFDYQQDLQRRENSHDQSSKIYPKPLQRRKGSWVSISEQPRFFLGDHAEIGLAPFHAQVGDVVCRFLRSDVTAILRPEEYRLSETLYGLVGRGLVIKSSENPKAPWPNPEPRGAGFGRIPSDYPGECLQWPHIKNMNQCVKIDLDLETLQHLTC